MKDLDKVKADEGISGQAQALIKLYYELSSVLRYNPTNPTKRLKKDDSLTHCKIFLLQLITGASPNDNEGWKMNFLAKTFGISTAAMTGMVGWLEKHKYVERVHGIRDRRKIFVLITEKGKSVLEEDYRTVYTAISLYKNVDGVGSRLIEFIKQLNQLPIS